MTDRTYTPGSFTKNFSWHQSYKKLHTSIRNGFSPGLEPIERETWRARSEIGDANRELIPLNFFLYSMRGLNEDFVVVDRLVERSFVRYDADFARLALFAFHLAASGNWHHSKWPDGKVAGWANDFIRTVAWNGGQWSEAAFTTHALKSFLGERIDGEAVTKRKVRTNYRYMLASAGVLVDERIEPPDLRASWVVDATELFWDRQIFGGEVHRSSNQKEFEAAFFRHEVYKLLGCTAEQGRAIALSTYRVYIAHLLPKRLAQLEKLRGLLAA
jgi:hypothetical protein